MAKDWSALLPWSCRLHLDGILPTLQAIHGRYRTLVLGIGSIRAQVPIGTPASACRGWVTCCLTDNVRGPGGRRLLLPAIGTWRRVRSRQAPIDCDMLH
jgi:hypothetical protein